MLKRFTDIQQRELEELGKNRGSLSHKLDIERERLRQIKAVSESMKRPGSQSALYMQNHTMISDKVRSLIEIQQQEVDIANLEYQRAHDSMVAQFGRVKGLEKVLDRRHRLVRKRVDQWEQVQQDDLSVRRFARGSLLPDSQ